MKTLTPEYIEHLKGERDRHLKIAEHLTAIIALDDPLAELVDNTTTEVTITRDPVRTTWSGLKKKKTAPPPAGSKRSTGSYVKGSCGRCGKTGHNAWHCPDRQSKKNVLSTKKKEIVNHSGKLCDCGRPAGHTGRHIGSPRSLAAAEPASKKLTYDEFTAEVARLAGEGKSSPEAAKILKANIKLVGRVWPRKLAPAGPGDIPDEEEEKI